VLLEINADRLVGGKVNDGKIGGAENESDCLDERKNEKRHVPRLDGGLIEKNGTGTAWSRSFCILRAHREKAGRRESWRFYRKRNSIEVKNSTTAKMWKKLWKLPTSRLEDFLIVSNSANYKIV
jgi:hypothetical protein